MLKEQFSIVPAHNSHIEQVIQISQDCKLNSWTADNYKNEINRSDSFNIICKGISSEKISGFLFTRLIRTLNTRIIDNKVGASHIHHKIYDEYDEVEILNIAVLPKHQNRGIGQLIFDFFKDFCIENTIKYIWLEVRESNIQAKNFYLKNGFQISYSRKNYYQNPAENAMILKLDLTALSIKNICKK